MRIQKHIALACLLSLVLALVLGVGAWYYVSSEADASEAENPASVHCTEVLGGTLETRDTAAGAIGVCHLPDGQACEEWTLFRTGACAPDAPVS